MTPDQVYTAFMTRQRRRHLSPKTIEWYEDLLPRMVRVLPPAATTDDIQAWIGMAPSAETASNWLRAARAMYSWASRAHGVVNIAAGVEPPRRRRRLPRVFTPAELRLIFDAARSYGPRELAMVTTLLDTGVRVGELASVRTERMHREMVIDPKTGDLAAITILTVSGKTGDREVPASAETVAALMAIAPPAGQVFRAIKGPDRPMPVTTLKDRVRDVLTAAGLTGRKLGPHTFRHTFATAYLKAGGDVYRLQRILGHATIKQTQAYLALSNGDAFAEHARLSPLVQLRGAM